MSDTEKRVVVVLSGGLDSAVLLAKYVREGFKVTCLTFDYGSKHGTTEQNSAKKLTSYYHVPHKFFRFQLSDILKSNLFIDDAGEIPDGHYEAESMKQTVVPFRNGIMLSLATGFAESLGYSMVAIGAHAGDHHIYPDCRLEFIRAFNTASKLGTDKGINIVAPFVNYTKSEIAELGSQLKVPFEMTYTCYKGGIMHCGTCGSCTERKEAFQLANIKDPTIYMNEKEKR